MNPHVPQTNRMGFAGGLLCAGLGLTAAVMLALQGWPTQFASAGIGQPLDAAAQTRELGLALIGLYAVPFEVASLLLLAALIGAIVLAKVQREPSMEPAPLADLIPAEQEPEPIEQSLVGVE
jgi:NADH:ubiquinone oxidoreductase subunit 6 (subunit J)